MRCDGWRGDGRTPEVFSSRLQSFLALTSSFSFLFLVSLLLCSSICNHAFSSSSGMQHTRFRVNIFRIDNDWNKS